MFHSINFPRGGCICIEHIRGGGYTATGDPVACACNLSNAEGLGCHNTVLVCTFASPINSLINKQCVENVDGPCY